MIDGEKLQAELLKKLAFYADLHNAHVNSMVADEDYGPDAQTRANWLSSMHIALSQVLECVQAATVPSDDRTGASTDTPPS